MMQGAVGRGKIAAIKNPPATKNLRKPAKNTMEIMSSQAVCREAEKPEGNDNRYKKVERSRAGGECVNPLRHLLANGIRDLAPESVPSAKVQEYQIR